ADGEANTIGSLWLNVIFPWMKKVWLDLKPNRNALKRNASPAKTSSRSSDLKLMAPPKLEV
ncbi:Hypothetical protein FKW44_006598, partial [Caligus rogercresseyi]